VGFYYEDFMYAVYGWGVGTALALIVCIPEWPFFNSNPIPLLSSSKSNNNNKSNNGNSKNNKKKTSRMKDIKEE